MAPKSRLIGGKKNFWLWTERDGFDLTHPPTPTSPLIYPRMKLSTRAEAATIAPSKTALVVVDMQNYFLSPALGRPAKSVGMEIVDRLLTTVIPACRKADIPIIWLGWGLEEHDLDDIPPAIARGYLFGLDKNFDGEPRDFGGLGKDIGQVELDDGTVIEAGRVMMRDQWNTAFYDRLSEVSKPQDIWVYKNRLSGFWGGTGVEEVLRARGITTLLFTGENTDQCVQSTMQDAYTKGWDCLMLSDGCSTTSPDFAREGVEFNCENGWGFVLTCQQLADGVDQIETAPLEQT